MYFSIASASISRTRFAIGERADIGFAGGLRVRVESVVLELAEGGEGRDVGDNRLVALFAVS
jgi:hypothetical protein